MAGLFLCLSLLSCLAATLSSATAPTTLSALDFLTTKLLLNVLLTFLLLYCSTLLNAIVFTPWLPVLGAFLLRSPCSKKRGAAEPVSICAKTKLLDRAEIGDISMSTEEVTKTRHPLNLPTSLPVEDIPPDDTFPADTLADKSIAAEALAEEQKEAELVAFSGEKGVAEESKTITEVVEKKVTVVEETVTTVEEVMQETGEVVAKSVTDVVTVDEIVTVNETVVSGIDGVAKLASGNGELMEVEEEKGDKKRLRDEAAVTDDGTEQVGDGAAAAAVKKLKSNGSELEELKGAAMATEEGEGEGEKKEQGGEDVKDAKSVGVIKLGPKVFEASVEMFTYFYDLLHNWNVNCDVNKVGF